MAARNTMQEVKSFTLKELEQHLHQLDIPFTTRGKHSNSLYTFKSLKQVEPNGIYFLVPNIPNLPKIENAIVLYTEETFGGENNITIKVDNPQLRFYQLMEAMIKEDYIKKGIHSTAIVGENCKVDPKAYIGPYCVLEGCIVKSGAKLHSHVTVMRGTTIEENVIIESHSTIGATGVAWIWHPTTRRRVIQPQTGYTTIGRDCFLGSDVTVVRGSINETTTIGEGCVIAHGSKIGHGSLIGPECHFANNISIAGNVTLGKQCFVGSGAVIRPQTKLADRTVIGAGAVVVKHIEEPGLVLIGSPAKPIKPVSNKMSGVPKPLDT